jgi:hypothetical protein
VTARPALNSASFHVRDPRTWLPFRSKVVTRTFDAMETAT